MGVPVLLNRRINPDFRPSANLLIWCFTGLVIFGYPVTSFVYWSLVLLSEVLPYDKDSIGLPIFVDLVAALILALPMLGLTKLALVFKAGPFRLWSWNRRRPLLSTVWSLALGGPAVYLVLEIVTNLVRPLPAYAYVWLPHVAALIAWLLVLRGAALSHATPR